MRRNIKTGAMPKSGVMAAAAVRTGGRALMPGQAAMASPAIRPGRPGPAKWKQWNGNAAAAMDRSRPGVAGGLEEL